MSDQSLDSHHQNLLKRQIRASMRRNRLTITACLSQALRRYTGRLVALAILTVLSPAVIARGLAGFCSTGRVFIRREVRGYMARPFSLLQFSGEFPAKKLALLINIVKGELAFVGPDINEQTDATRLSVRPGLVSTYRIRKKVCIAHEDELTADQEYVYNNSLKSDAGILLRNTISNLLNGTQKRPEPYSIDFFGIKVWNTRMQDAVKWILMETHNKDKKQLAFVNPDCLNIAFNNSEYKQLLLRLDHVLPDGIGIKIGCRMLKVALKDNVNGTDMFPVLCEQMADTTLSMFLLGAKPGVAQKTADNMRQRFPGLKICGTHDGYFSDENESDVIDYINQCKPDVLLVAMGAPKQDLWIARNLDRLDTHIAMGVGGLFDFYSGMTRRAPRWVREIGLEWGWRILQEPKRMWKRYVIGNPLFLYRVMKFANNGNITKRDMQADKIEVKLAENTTYISKRIKRVVWKINYRTQSLAKRGFDMIIASLALMSLSPLMLMTALAIRLESEGPILFNQIRIGKDGKPFQFWKFRSMYIDAEDRKKALMESNEMQGGVLFKMRKDPRITRVGRIIRKTSIDELPQLWNVITGDMSLVGPRPCLPGEADKYSSNDRYRLSGTPGITCIWQISGRSDIPFEQQVKMDLEYINKSSIRNDILILLKTIPAVITGRGAY